VLRVIIPQERTILNAKALTPKSEVTRREWRLFGFGILRVRRIWIRDKPALNLVATKGVPTTCESARYARTNGRLGR